MSMNVFEVKKMLQSTNPLIDGVAQTLADNFEKFENEESVKFEEQFCILIFALIKLQSIEITNQVKNN